MVAVTSLTILNPLRINKVQLNNERSRTSNSQPTTSSRDIRVEAIKSYFSKWGVPAGEKFYAEKFIQEADQFNLPPYLLPAIAFVESTGGKNYTVNNWFGYGCDGHCVHFASPSAGIEKVAEALSGNGKDGHYYAGKTIIGKLATYNSVSPTYPQRVIGISEEIAMAENQLKANLK